MPTEQYKASLNIQDVLTNLNKIDKSNEKVWKKAEKDANTAIKGIIAGQKRLLSLTNKLDKSLAQPFKNAGSTAQASGVQIGAVAGVVTALTQQFIQLGQQAVTALIDIGKQSIETAIEIDTLKARLGGIFDGNKEAADQAFTFIQEKSKKLGFDLSELAGAFIPKTESLAQFERVAKLATALARSDPEQGAIGARIALIESLSGTFTSLNRRFEISKQDTQRIQDAFNTDGIEGFLTTLEDVLAKGGRSFDDFNKTASTAFARLDIAGKQIGGRLGVPIVESLERASNKILDFIDANEDDLIVFADTIGRAISNLIDLFAEFDFKSIDTKQLEEIGETLFDLVDNARVFAAVLSDTDVPIGLIDGVQTIADTMNTALETAIKLSALVKGEIARQNAENAAAAALGPSVPRGTFGQVNTGLLGGADKIAVETAGQAAFNKVIQETVDLLDDSTKRKEENRQASDDLRTSLDEAANAGTAAADAAQALARAQDAAAASGSDLADAEEKAAEETAKATEKFNEGAADAEIDLQRKLADVEKEGTRKRLDAAADFAQKRVDLALKNQQAIEDIERKNQQAVTDAGTDLERNEQDIATKFAREKLKLAKDDAQKQVDIEKELRQKIADIRKQFNRDAEESEQKRDAIGFLAALKKRNQEITDAQTERNRKTQEAKKDGQIRRDELKLQQQQELEDARLANERKLEDLRLALERDLDAQAINFQQEQDALTVAEQRKNEELKLWQERAIEDANTAHTRKLEDLQLALDRELAVITAHVDAAAAAYERLQAIASQSSVATNKTSSTRTSSRPSTTGGASAGFGSNPSTISTGTKPKLRLGFSSVRSGKASGGNVFAPGVYPVGEYGPELYSPGQSGRIFNQKQMERMAMPYFGGGGSTTNNSKQISLSIPPDKLTPGQRAEARMLALEVLDGTS